MKTLNDYLAMSQPEKYTGPFFRKNAVAITAEELFRSFLISQTRSRAVFTAISLPMRHILPSLKLEEP